MRALMGMAFRVLAWPFAMVIITILFHVFILRLKDEWPHSLMKCQACRLKDGYVIC
jgi:hypothetical protein